MSLGYSLTLRNNRLQQLQTTIGAAGTLKIFSGPEPANCAAPDPGGLLVTMTLPATFISVSGGATSLAGSWNGIASGTGVAASFRMYDGSSNCHLQGGIPSEMTLSFPNITTGFVVTVNTFVITTGNP